jgi:hypothetical protein
MMVDLAAMCGERKLRLRDEASIGREVLETECAYTHEEAISAEKHVSLWPGVSGGGSLGPDWSLLIHRTALEYRDVHGADDL